MTHDITSSAVCKHAPPASNSPCICTHSYLHRASTTAAAASSHPLPQFRPADSLRSVVISPMPTLPSRHYQAVSPPPPVIALATVAPAAIFSAFCHPLQPSYPADSHQSVAITVIFMTLPSTPPLPSKHLSPPPPSAASAHRLF